MKINFKPKHELVVFDDPDVQHECCAVLYGKKTKNTITVEAFAVVKNSADDTRNDFAMKRGDVSRVTKRRGYKESDIIGSIHTHPPGSKADPSWSDVDDCPPGMIGVVYHVSTRTLSYYNNEAGWLDKETL